MTSAPASRYQDTKICRSTSTVARAHFSLRFRKNKKFTFLPRSCSGLLSHSELQVAARKLLMMHRRSGQLCLLLTWIASASCFRSLTLAPLSAVHSFLFSCFWNKTTTGFFNSSGKIASRTEGHCTFCRMCVCQPIYQRLGAPYLIFATDALYFYRCLDSL